MAPTLKLYYFDMPGRAEPTKLMLNYAGIPFENFTFPRDQWPELKQKMPYGQVPVLEVDGKMLAQSAAIERYAAKLAGLTPEDSWSAAKVDEYLELVKETWDIFMPSFSIKDADEKVKARQAIVEGPLKVKLLKLTEILSTSGGSYLTGDKITQADFSLFTNVSLLVCGFIDGIPKDLLDSYPEMKAYHNRIASLPVIAKMYENPTSDYALAFRPL